MQHTSTPSKSQEARSQTGRAFPGAVTYRTYNLLIREGHKRYSVVIFNPAGMIIQIVEAGFRTWAWKQAASFVDRELVRQTSAPSYRSRIEAALEAACVECPAPRHASVWEPEQRQGFDEEFGVLHIVHLERAERLESLCMWAEEMEARLPKAAWDAYLEAKNELKQLSEQAAAIRFEIEAAEGTSAGTKREGTKRKQNAVTGSRQRVA